MIDEKSKRLRDQWPKRCGCGRDYRPDNRDPKVQLRWDRLPWAYKRTDTFATFEARNCACGSTLEVILAIHDLAEE
jgi:hypothetical protein